MKGGVKDLAEEGVNMHRVKGLAEVYGEEGSAVGRLVLVEASRYSLGNWE